MSNRLKWKPGQRGKGLYTRNGDIHTWPLDRLEGPQHAEYVDLHNLDRQAPSFNFAIDPDGYVHDNDIGFDNRTHQPDQHVLGLIQQADPNLHRNQGPGDDWELDDQIPGVSGEATGPDYNFVLGASMWDQMMNPGIPCPRCKSDETVLQDENRIRCNRCRHVFPPPSLVDMAMPLGQPGAYNDFDDFFHSKVASKPFHLSQRTGLPCYCKYGSPSKRMSRTAGVEWNRFKKQIGKKFMQLPEAQEYLNVMDADMERDHQGWIDEIVPFLNKEFKAGRIQVVNDPGYQRSYLKTSNGDIVDAPKWGQWAAARQHPTRRGVNITSPDFTVNDIMQRSNEFHEDMENQQRLEQYQEACQDAGHTVHEWPDGWHVKQIGHRPDMELEGEVMNHCIGNEGEHPFTGYDYTDAANDGRINVYSLRDPQGMPHATYHTNRDSHTLAEVHGRANHALKPEYEERVHDHLGQMGIGTTAQGDDFENPNDEEYEEEEEENPYSHYYRVEAPDTVDEYRAIYENNDLDGKVDPEYNDACRWAEDHYGDEPELEYERPNWPAIGEDLLNEIDQWGLDPHEFIEEVARHHSLGDLYTAVQAARREESDSQYGHEPDKPSMQPDVPEGDTPQEHGRLFDPHSIQDDDDWEDWNESRKDLDDAFKSWKDEDGSFMHPSTRDQRAREEHGRQYPHGTEPASQKLYQEPTYRDEDIKYPIWDEGMDPDSDVQYLDEQRLRQRKINLALRKMEDAANAGQTDEQIKAQFPQLGGYATQTPEEEAWMNYRLNRDAERGVPSQVGQPQPAGQMTSSQLREGDTFTMPEEGHGLTYRAVDIGGGVMWAVSTDATMSRALTGIERVIQTGAPFRGEGQPQPMPAFPMPHQTSADSDYAAELVAWLHDVDVAEAVAPTPHHQSPQDMAPTPPLAANEPPYWPPGHVPDWADPAAEGRTSAEDALIERAITPAEYDASLEPRKQRGPWLKRLFRRR